MYVLPKIIIIRNVQLESMLSITEPIEGDSVVAVHSRRDIQNDQAWSGHRAFFFFSYIHWVDDFSTWPYMRRASLHNLVDDLSWSSVKRTQVNNLFIIELYEYCSFITTYTITSNELINFHTDTDNHAHFWFRSWPHWTTTFIAI